MIMIAVSILLVIRMDVESSPLNKAEEETTRDNSIRIIGGVEAVPHSLAYQVGLIIDSANFCGGVLISTEHILTTAHCIYEISSIEVILGAHNIDHHEDTQKIFYNPMVIIHANYNKALMRYDIALLKLGKRIQLTWAINPVQQLADDDSGDFLGCTGLLSGWGYTSHSSGHVEANLRQVYLDIISNHKCNSNLLLTRGVSISNSQICTWGIDRISGSVSACFGDSGGPLVVGNVLVGLVSFGYEICEAGHPTVYTRISYYRDWIAKFSGI